MSSWPGPISAITLFVEDRAAAKAFYSEALGLPVHYEDAESVVFAFGATLVNLLVATAAPELIEPAQAAAPDSGARSVLTVTVDNVDAACSQLATHGVELLNGPVDRRWGVGTACFRESAD